MTRAISSQQLIDVSKQIHKTSMLMFGADNKITVALFDIIDQQVTHWSENKVEQQERIDFSEIANACILYQIAQREGQTVGVGTYNNEVALRSITKYISDDITNKDVVAHEIYNSWNSLAKKSEFIKNVSGGRVRVDHSRAVRSMFQPLTPIPNFRQFFEGLIAAYINTVANEKNLQLWSLEQTVELFMSTFTGSGFNYTDRARAYFVLDTQIAQCLNKPAADKAKLTALRERLKAENGELALTSEFSDDKILQNVIGVAPVNYTYADFISAVNAIVEPYGLHTKNTDICEHTFLRLVGIDIIPEVTQIGPSQRTPDFMFIDLSVTADIARQFAVLINQKYQVNLAEYTPEFNQPNTHAIRMNINLVMEHVMAADFKTQVAKDLSNKLILQNYQAAMRGEAIPFNNILSAVSNLGKAYNLTTMCDFFEASLLQTFGVDAAILQAAQFSPAARAEGFAMDTDFYLGIDPANATQLLANINQQFPGAASLIANNQKLPSKGDIALQHIAIKSSVLISPGFLGKIQAGLAHISEHQIDVLEKLEIQCGKRRFTTQSFVRDLNAMATKYTGQDPMLANALSVFATDLSLRKPKQEYMLTSFKLQQAIALHESQAPNIDCLSDFKETDKALIKLIQREVGARAKKLHT